MNKFVDRCKKELDLAKLFDKDSDYGGMLGDWVLELAQIFSDQGHSGMSAIIVSSIFHDLVLGKTLTPITNSPFEWMEVSENLYQNTRRSTSFSRDGGKTWYDIEDATLNNGDTR